MTQGAVLDRVPKETRCVKKTIQPWLKTKQLDTSVPVVVIAPGYHGQAIARSLGRIGVRVYGIHADPKSPAARSRYWQQNIFRDLTKLTPDESVDYLLQFSREIGERPILIPTDDYSCLFVADHAAKLKQGFLLPDQPAGLARSLSSKETMYLLCKQYSVPTPDTVFPRSRDGVIEYLKAATFPIMLKGIDTVALLRRAGTRMVLVEDEKTLLKFYNKMEVPGARNLMLQTYIPGSSEMVWMFNGYFDDRSECLFAITGQKIRQYPANKGVTSLGICVTNEDVIRQTRDFMKAIGYRGILDIGYKYDSRDQQYKLLDVNPRIGTTFRLFVDTNGLDVVRTLYCDLTGQQIVQGMTREGRKWVVENFDAVSSVQSLRDGDAGISGWVRSFRGLEETSWFASDDLLPFLAMVWHSLRWLLHRLLKVPSPKDL